LHNDIDIGTMAEVVQPEISSKKRKRTGKQREEAKRLAIVSPSAVPGEKSKWSS
jgi:hypothetical protein